MKKFYFLFLLALLASLSSAYAAEATVTYTFTSMSWNATLDDGTNANWSSGKSGSQFTSGQGVQTTSKQSGANATSSESYTNVSKIVVKYCTNNNKGAGSIAVNIGDNDAISNAVKAPSSGGTTLKELTFTPTSLQSGKIKITVTCTTNSIYVYSVAVTYVTSEEGKVSAPVFTPASGDVALGNKISMSCQTEDATVYYSTNGTDYIEGSEYTPNTVGELKLYAKATKDGVESDVTEATFNVVVGAPTFSVASGSELWVGDEIQILPTTPGSELYYSVDNGATYVEGSSYTPTAAGELKILAKAKKSDVESAVSFATYTVKQHDLATWTKVTETPASWQGDYLIVNEAASAAFDGSLTILDKASNYQTVTINDASIETDGCDYYFTIVPSGDNVTIQSASGYYIGLTGTSTGMNTNKTTSYANTITVNSGAVVIKSNNVSLQYNNRFRYYTSSQKAIALYKKVMPAEMPTFTPASGDVNLGDKITIATTTEGATLYYSLDGTTWTEGSEYTPAASGELTLYAKAVKNGGESYVATATFNVVSATEIGEITITTTGTKGTTDETSLFGKQTFSIPLPTNATQMTVNFTGAYEKSETVTGDYSLDVDIDAAAEGSIIVSVLATNDSSKKDLTKSYTMYSDKVASVTEFVTYGAKYNDIFTNPVFEFTCPLTVTFAKGVNMWVTDGQESILIYTSGETYQNDYKNGDVFAEGVKGVYTVYNGQMEITNSVLTATTSGEKEQPTDKLISDITTADHDMLVVITDATATAPTNKNGTLTVGESSIPYFSGKNYCNAPTAEGVYDVVGIVNTYKTASATETTVQIYPLAFLKMQSIQLGFDEATMAEKTWLEYKTLTDGLTVSADRIKFGCDEGYTVTYSISNGTDKKEGTITEATEVTLNADTYELTYSYKDSSDYTVTKTYMFEIDSTSSVAGLSADNGVKVTGEQGGVAVEAAEAADVAVYTTAGQLATRATVGEGRTLISVAPGFYVVRANGTAAKVIVK